MIHDRDYFYKYVPAETALKILQNRTLKYSCPAIFNDPFDCQTRMDFNFEVRDLVEAFLEELYLMTHAAEEPVGDESVALFRDIQKMWRIAKQSKRKMPKDIWIKETKSLAEETVQLCKGYLEEMNNWKEQLSKATRVLCLAEEPDNLLMWAHYSQDHKGVVLKFRCLSKSGSPLLASRKVNYSDKPPTIAELDDYVKYLTGQSPDLIDYKTGFIKLFTTKSDHWFYEQEWRVFIPPFDIEKPSIKIDDKGNEILFDLVPFHSQELHSIYFGCKILDEDHDDLMACLNAKDMRHVKKIKCSRSLREYKLEFEEITN